MTQTPRDGRGREGGEREWLKEERLNQGERMVKAREGLDWSEREWLEGERTDERE